MAYNGVGLRTVRGSGTNGYIQKNRSSIAHLHRNDNPPDLKPPVTKAPNTEILLHEKKRQIELKVLLYEEQLKERKTPKADITRMCSILREQLTEKFNRDPSAMKSNLSETHQKIAAKQKEDAKIRTAFGIKEAHVEGAAYEQLGNPGYMAKDTSQKAAAIASAKAKQREKEEKELADPKLPKSFLENSVYTEEEYRERQRRERERDRFRRGGGGGGDHWRPPRSRSRSRSFPRERPAKGGKRSRSRSPVKKEEESVGLSLIQGKKKKKDKKGKDKPKKKKDSSSSSSSSSSDSDSDSSSSSSD